MPQHAAFRDLLAALPETGEAGFEGLVAVACSQVSGVAFRLVGSGRQFGRDGEAVFQGAAMLFEAKRYSRRLSFADLVPKVVEALERSRRAVEVWAAAATVPLEAMVAEDLRALGETYGVTVLLLDWSAPSPRLAVLLAAAREAVADWFDAHAPHDASSAAAMVEQVRNGHSYQTTLTELRGELSPPTLGLAMAKRRNADWIGARFSDKRAAMRMFNQPLAPMDQTLRPAPFAREVLEARLRRTFSSWTGAAEIVVVTGAAFSKAAVGLEGDEGLGKTWAVARAWASMSVEGVSLRPLLLVMTSDMWREGDEVRPIDLLARLCMQQGGSVTNAQGVEVWRRRLERWLGGRTERGSPPLLLVVLDGINERAHPWAALIVALADLASKWSLRVVVTTRRGAFERDLAPRLSAIDIDVVTVEAFSEADLDAALARDGRDPTGIGASMKAFLRNPRVLSVALPLLDRLDPEEVGVERLLFEYLVKRQEERTGGSSVTAPRLAQVLVGHARELLGRLTATPPVNSRLFDPGLKRANLPNLWHGLASGLEDIVDSQFLVVVDPRRDRYRFTSQALPLGMALLVVDELDSAAHEGRESDLPELLSAMVEPVGALDATSTVVLAALEVAIADNVSGAVAAELLVATLKLQNLQPGQQRRIFAGLRARPAVYVAATDLVHATPGAAGRRDWLIAALHAKRFDPLVEPTLDAAIRRWLRSWQPTPISPETDGLSAAQAESMRADYADRQRRHHEGLAAMTLDESAYVKRELITLPEGVGTGVDEAATTLLAGRALLPFAADLHAWCVATSISWGHGSHHVMRWLRLLAPVDWEATVGAVGAIAERYSGRDGSENFRWAYDHAMSYGGDTEQARLADAGWPSLHNGPRRSVVHAWDNLCDVEPLNPDASFPSLSLDRARTLYTDWCRSREGGILLMRHADTVATRTRAILCRFEPDVAADGHRDFARAAQEVTAAPAIVAGFIAHDTAILSNNETRCLREWLRNMLAGGAADRATREAAAALLATILPRLAPLEQFNVVAALPGPQWCPLWLENLMDPLSDDVLAASLADVVGRGGRSFAPALLFAGAHRVEPGVVRPAIALALAEGDPPTRGMAIRTLLRMGGAEDLFAFADAGWSWDGSLCEESNAEAFCGSVCLVKALAAVDDPALLARIHPALWSRAVLGGGERIASAVADGMLTALATTATRPPEGMDVTLTRSDEAADAGDLTGIDITIGFPFVAKAISPDAQQHTLTMSDYKAFEREMVDGARAPFMYPVTSAAVDRISKLAPIRFEQLVSHVEGVSESAERDACAVLAHDLARALSFHDAARAALLFSQYSEVRPLLPERMPLTGAPRQIFLLWSADDVPVIEAERRRRVQAAPNDEILADHAAVAALAGRSANMKALVIDMSSKRHPAVAARALTLAGFSLVDDVYTELLEHARFRHGFLAEACGSASQAYRQAVWASHWWQAANDAHSALDVWRFGELAAVAADGRYASWARKLRSRGWLRRTMPMLRSTLQASADRMRRERRSTLFGERRPPDVFFQQL